MNTHSIREYFMFEPAQLMRNWREQRPSNQGGLDPSVTREDGSLLHRGAHASDFIFVPNTLLLLGGVFIWYTL
jgi:hypothetical protein